jgi:NAD+ diphosphatase
MKKSLFGPSGPLTEPSNLTAFSGNRLNRLSENRSDDCLDIALATDGSKLLAFSGTSLVLKKTGTSLDPLFSTRDITPLEPEPSRAILLGFDDQALPYLAMPVGIAVENLRDTYQIADGRTLFRDMLVTEDILGQYAQGSSLITWNRDHQFCGRCGEKMQPKSGGYQRRCMGCDHVIFPRTDPVVIMLIVDEERDMCLLGRGAHFPPGMYSCLAGFVEPGETIENAVRRETYEESRIEVGKVVYHASQPWPMPHSLMIGCFGQALSRDIQRDEKELEDCQWYDRSATEAMLNAVSSDGRSAPAKGAIAQSLMRDWLEWDG